MDTLNHLFLGTFSWNIPKTVSRGSRQKRCADFIRSICVERIENLLYFLGSSFFILLFVYIINIKMLKILTF